jgi:hypothetical protein
MEMEGSFLCSRQFATGSYHESDKSSPHSLPIALRSILILSYLCPDILCGLLPSHYIFQQILHVFFIYPMHTCCLGYSILPS